MRIDTMTGDELLLLDGLRVVDFSTEIAGPYATKLLSDAGADVVKVEPPAGDPMRRWVASGSDRAGSDGALFRVLNAGKRSIVGALDDGAVRSLLAAGDVVVESGQLTTAQLDDLLASYPHLVVVSVTPFGRDGPWADRPSTEFTLQAMCGSIGGRGSPDREPFHAGGRLGEWIGGLYTGVVAASAARAARRTARGDHVDVSILECMSATMGGYRSVRLGAPKAPRPGRGVELPSIEPTADGYVGVCTVTGQQFLDFLVLIDQAELAADTELASMAGRQRRRDEFLPLVWSWTTKRTTDEIVDLASAMRIPVVPIGTPENLTTIDQFVERGVFVQSADGDFVQSRVPYRVDGCPIPRPRRAPTLGQHTGRAAWSHRERRPARGRELPLEGVRVADLTAFWAGPAATQVLALLGADVVKVESVQRPDGMRLASTKSPDVESWYEWSALYQANNVDKRGITLDLGRAEGRTLLLDLVSHSDVVIDNFSPRVMDNFGLTYELIRAVNPGVVMVRMPAFGLDGPWRDRTGFAQTMEQGSGMAWMTGFRDGPPTIVGGPCDPIAGLHAAFAVIAALEERDRSGRGHFVEATMVEAALNVAAELVVEHAAYGASLCRDGNRGPVSAPQGLYRSRGEDCWLALAVSTDDQWRALREVLGTPPWASGSDLETAAGRRRAHDALDAHLGHWAAYHDAETLAERLVAAGVPAARVADPDRVFENPQLRARGFVEAVDHPLLGGFELMGAPFRFRSRPGGSVRAPAPTLGQHNDEVLGAVLGVDAASLRRLRDNAIIGERPVSPTT